MDKNTVSAPISIFTPTYNREKVLRNLQACGIKRVLLCGRSSIGNDGAKRQEVYDKLPQEVKFFHDHGLEAWYWRWAFMIPNHHYTQVVSYRGNNVNMVCPLDPDFQSLVREDLKKIAATGVDGILYDDDFRFDNAFVGLGCACARHRTLTEKILGHPMNWDDLEKGVLCGAPSPERNALLKVWGDSLKDFARLSRAAVDEVNPECRFGFCACITGYDGDGATPMELAKCLAGKTRPYVRLIGAPYWVEQWVTKIRLPELIEYEKWQSAMMPEEYEIVAEGDVWPRPRFKVPAAYLEIFDSALHFDGSLNGIQKYMFDYVSSANYETGYMEQHIGNQAFHATLAAWLDGTQNAGIRVWHQSNLIADGDFRDIPDKAIYLDGAMLYPQSAFALAPHGLPAVHSGSGCAAICFGESARTLPADFKKRPLIIDIAAAKLLKERGWDVGLVQIGERFKPAQERFDDGEVIPLANRQPGSRKLTLAAGTKVLSHFDDEAEAASFSYRAPDGGRYLVLNFEGTVSDESSWRNYCFPKRIRAFLSDCRTPLPAAVTTPAPDLYLQCRTGENNCIIGIWNAHADHANNLQIKLGEKYRSAEFVSGEGKLEGDILTLREMPGFSFTAVRLTKLYLDIRRK